MHIKITRGVVVAALGISLVVSVAAISALVL